MDLLATLKCSTLSCKQPLCKSIILCKTKRGKKKTLKLCKARKMDKAIPDQGYNKTSDIQRQFEPALAKFHLISITAARV